MVVPSTLYRINSTCRLDVGSMQEERLAVPPLLSLPAALFRHPYPRMLLREDILTFGIEMEGRTADVQQMCSSYYYKRCDSSQVRPSQGQTELGGRSTHRTTL